MQYMVVLDDRKKRNDLIEDVIGKGGGYSDIVVDRIPLEKRYRRSIEKLFPAMEWELLCSSFDCKKLLEKLTEKENVYENIRVLHCRANFIIAKEEEVLLSFEKLNYIQGNYVLFSEDNEIVAMMFCSLKSYMDFLLHLSEREDYFAGETREMEAFQVEGFLDISKIENFIQCITGNFDSRYFNSLSGDEYTLVKSSANKKKIKSEYEYYYLLPEDMKHWYIQPFDYQEEEERASYTMERLHMANIAIKWIHGAIDLEEFERLMDKYFYFFQRRHRKNVTREEYQKIEKNCYVDKVNSRVDELKKLPEYKKIEKLLEDAVAEGGIDGLVKRYVRLKEKIGQEVSYPLESVIGHGDPCFSNALYYKSTRTLKFIDPKGALIEPELWTNPYYDIAKLSHSVCGLYDFLNNSMFDIRVNEAFKLELKLEFDNTSYIEIFKRKLEEKGFDYWTVRIYEASLFLSMLPLHIDYPYKVLGFILKAVQILEEVENHVS